jgi:hypothetical protein
MAQKITDLGGAMTNGLFSDLFVQAELDYRRDRAISETHPRLQAQRNRHTRRWPLNRGSTRPSSRSHGLVE